MNELNTTLVIIKPPSISKGLVGALIGAFEDNHMVVSTMRQFMFTQNLMESFYGHVADREFFPDMVKLYTSEPSIALTLNPAANWAFRDGIIQEARNMLPELRAAYGHVTVPHNNKIHASDSPASVCRELELVAYAASLGGFPWKP